MLAIAGLIATVIGTAMQMQQAQQNAKAVRRASEAAARRQLEHSDQAAQTAAKRAQEMKTETRQEEQKEIEQDLQQQFYQPTAENLERTMEEVATQGNVSSDYEAAKAKANAARMEDTENLSNLLAKQLSAGRLRQYEGFKNADTASQIGMIQNFAQGDQRVGEGKIAQAANNVGTLGTLGSLASGLGSMGMMMGDWSKLNSAFNGLFSPSSGAITTTAATGSPLATDALGMGDQLGILKNTPSQQPLGLFF